MMNPVNSRSPRTGEPSGGSAKGAIPARQWTRADEQILLALSRYQYLTARQVCRLLYSPGSLTYVQTRLKSAVHRGYFGRTFLTRVDPTGSSPAVYYLATKGRKLAESHGAHLPTRFRPVEEKSHAFLFLAHAVEVADFLLSAELLCRTRSEFRLAEVLHDRHLKQHPTTVEVDGRKRSVVPDGYLDIHVADKYQTCIALELDRGSMEQRRWRDKIAGLIAWASGPYQAAFRTNSLTIAVLASPGTARRDQLRRWTEAELKARSREPQASLFRFAGFTPALARPSDVFCAPIWQVPLSSDGLVPLLEVPGH